MKISSFLPNPIGSDKEGELFTVFNDSENTISLNSWRVQDEAGRNFWLFGSLGAQEETSFSLKGSSLVLNNNGESLYLYSPNGILVDELSYIGSASEGQTIKKELTITEELKEEYFEDYAFQPFSANVLSSNPTSPIYLSAVFALLLAALSIFLINRIPKTEEEIIIEEYESETTH